MKKLRILWYLLISKSYIVVTDKAAISQMPILDPYSLGDVVIVGAQALALKEIRDELDEIITEHKLVIKNMSRRK